MNTNKHIHMRETVCRIRRTQTQRPTNRHIHTSKTVCRTIQHTITNKTRTIVIAVLFLAVCMLGAIAPLAAIPQAGELRLAAHAELSNAYFADRDRVDSAQDIFSIALVDLNVRDSISSQNLFALGMHLHLEYGIDERFAVGVRAGLEYTFDANFPAKNYRIPLLASANIVTWNWLELRPEVGMNIIYDTAAVALPHLHTGLTVRILDRIDLNGAFIYGAIAGFQFSATVRLFDIFNIPLTESATRARLVDVPATNDI